MIISIYVIITTRTVDTTSDSFKKENENIEFNLKNEKKIDSILTESVLHLADLINNDHMTYTEWVKYIRNLPPIDIDGHKYFLIGHESVPYSDELIVIMTPTSSFTNEYKYNTLWSEWYLQESSFEVTSDFNVEKNHNYIMMQKAKINIPQSLSYNRIDPKSEQNVVKNSIYVKWISKEGHTGIIYYGYNVENLNSNKKQKYLDLIYKLDLSLTSFLLLITSLIILSTNSKYNIFKALLFLFVTHIYIFIYLNTDEPYSSDIKTETEKNDDITASILGMSFLSGVNIFIMNFIYKNKKQLFIEISCMFGVSIILLLVAIYKALSKNYLSDLISARITNQLVFNLAVFLNGTIILNFLFYNIFYIYKKKLH
jgi:hypothetical protein